jgi:NodT family efflux transporter outer membrane factor (OMF) lipoprotein
MTIGTFNHKTRLYAVITAAAFFLASCNVGPKYHTPSVQAPAAYKEVTPENAKDIDNWKAAQPSDAVMRGNWWEVFGDPELNQLEEQAGKANQSIASAAASFLAARALVKQARSQLFPTVTTNPSITRSRQSPNLKGVIIGSGGTGTGGGSNGQAAIFTTYELPFDATWVPDLWGKVRNTIASNAYAAQASDADLANTRLTIHAEVAVDYFELRSQDALKRLLDSTVEAYKQSLDLTKALFETGIDSDESVAQAETQLETTQAQDTNVGILRSQYEHAIAMLVGEPASTFSIPVKPLTTAPPPIPFGVPSELLERRPDIAASERLVAQANAQIGIARAAYFPTLTLNAAGGFESSSITNWLSWPSRYWSVGPSLAETIFDAGLRKATVEQYRAQYDETVANYRQTVLTAFQQVEDNLSGLRILSQEIDQQNIAINSSQRYLDLAVERYRLGIDPYLNVISAQTTLLTNKQTLVTLQLQQITDSVQLVEAVGGGWTTSQMPSAAKIATSTP